VSGPSVDLRTTYLGLGLRSPVVPSASPIGRDVDLLRRAADAGAGAVVLPSLFEEQVQADARDLLRLLSQGAGSFVEAATFFPEVGEYRTGAVPYLRHLEATVAAVDVPVIASLNGTTPGGWTRYAVQQAEAGAAAIELNAYQVAADPDETSAEVEQRLVDLVAQVCSQVDVPVAVKLSPWYSALGHLCRRLVATGAAGLVLFNRFVQPDVDLDTLEVVDRVHLSDPAELAQPLRWCALLRDRVDVSLAVSSGVHDGDGAAKAVLVGADVVMTASALLRHGPEHVGTILDGLRSRLAGLGYESLAQARGALSAGNAPDPDAFERAHYITALTRYRSPAAGLGADDHP
jgi:dihydroorotate dehydrogenase (fumarate)